MKRNEYPRPQFVRKEWTNLNGEWLFMYDDDNVGIQARWFENQTAFQKKNYGPLCLSKPREWHR